MQTAVFYIIEPTVALHELAVASGQEYVAQHAVWHVVEHDRVGASYSKSEIARAHWLQFVANLIGDGDESSTLVNLREKCLSLGFNGCWTVSETKVGGDAKELMNYAQEAQEFLSQRGIAAS